MKHLINPDLEPKIIYRLYKDIKQTYKFIYNNNLVKLYGKVSKDYVDAVERQLETLSNIKKDLYNLLCDKLNNGKVIQEHLIKQKLEEYERNTN